MSEAPSPTKCLSVREVASETGLGLRTVWSLIATKKLKVVRVNHRTLVRQVDLVSFLESQQEETHAE